MTSIEDVYQLLLDFERLTAPNVDRLRILLHDKLTSQELAGLLKKFELENGSPNIGTIAKEKLGPVMPFELENGSPNIGTIAKEKLGPVMPFEARSMLCSAIYNHKDSMLEDLDEEDRQDTMVGAESNDGSFLTDDPKITVPLWVKYGVDLQYADVGPLPNPESRLVMATDDVWILIGALTERHKWTTPNDIPLRATDNLRLVYAKVLTPFRPPVSFSKLKDSLDIPDKHLKKMEVNMHWNAEEGMWEPRYGQKCRWNGNLDGIALLEHLLLSHEAFSHRYEKDFQRSFRNSIKYRMELFIGQEDYMMKGA
jgi:hypothetical protein